MDHPPSKLFDADQSTSPNSPVALVTGSGANRVGNHVARGLAAHGFAVAVHYATSKVSATNTVADITEQGGTACDFQADVTLESEVDELIDTVGDHFGRIDLLVTTASRWEKQSFEDVRTEDIRSTFEVDCLGTFLCARKAGLVMTQQDTGGNIVLIGDASIYQPRTGEPAYYLAKATIPTMTRMLAVELAERQPSVRVNAILPGSVMAPNTMTSAQQQQRRHATLTRTADNPDAVTQAVLYLTNASFVTGTCLTVDGGRKILRPGPG
jgi:pteridine reductase